jgi:glycosyltransferase involved in cell wall biosynthesis
MNYPGYQDLQPLIRAIARLHTSGRINPGQILVWLFGPNNKVYTPLIKKYALEAYFMIRGSIAHPESIALQTNADLLLFLEWTDQRQKGIFTTKFFEYLGAGKPILGVGPRGGVVSDALGTTGAGIMISDPDEIADQIHFFLNHGFFQNRTKPYRPDFEKLKKYSRDYQTRILARLMDKTLNATSPAF